MVGNVGGPAPLAVLVPGLLGQEQVGVEHGREVAAAAGEVDGDDAVVDLAASPAVLPLHAGGLVPLLGRAGLVDPADDADIVRGTGSGSRQVLQHDAALHLVPHEVVIPDVFGKELLERADGGAGGQGDRLDALARQVAEQSAGVGLEVSEGLLRHEAASETAQVRRECRPQRGDLFFGHP